MARAHPNSKVNPQALDADQAYNRAVNRGQDIDTQLDVAAVKDQPASRFPNRFKGDTATQG